MKLLRVFAALIVAVMVLSVFAGCSGKVVSKVHIKFIVTAEADDSLDEDKVIGETDVEVEGTTKNPPTVLKAAQLALTKLSYEDGYETTSDGYSIARIRTYAEHQETDDSTGYYTYWDAYINGERSTSGRQSETPIYNNDTLEFKFISSSTPRRDNDKYVDESENND